MIAAGVNAKALSDVPRARVDQITLDRYGHLMPGTIAEAARLLDISGTDPRADRRAGAGNRITSDFHSDLAGLQKW